MEKQRPNIDTPAAQQAAEWLTEYLYGDGQPADVLPEVTRVRLGELLKDDNGAALLRRFKGIFLKLEPEHQAIAGLYAAGYSSGAIAALAEGNVRDMMAAVRQQMDPSLRAVQSSEAYIPLKTLTDQLHKPVAIDEVQLKETCRTINELEPEVFTERLRQVPQYLPAPTKDLWLRILTEWLDGRGVSELAESHGLDESRIATQLTRVGKVFLRHSSTERVYRTLTSDDLAWQAQALCAQTGGDIFFPDKGEPATDPKKICTACEVGAQCDEYRKRVGHDYGIFAGKTTRESKKETTAR